MSKIYNSQGTSPDIVSQDTNTTGKMDTVLTVQPDRGTFLRILAAVSKGQTVGVPVYAKLRDSGNSNLPVDTQMQFVLEPAGMDATLKVSAKIESINEYHNLSLSEQRNRDNVDQVKIKLQQPETQGGEPLAPDEYIDFRDVDSFQVQIKSSTQIDWSNSEFYIDSNAIRGPFQR